jgi:hypothetical protein
VTIAFASAWATDAAQLKKLRTGTAIGQLQTVSPAKNKRDIIIDVLSPGEEKPRSYTVGAQQKSVVAAVQGAKVGDRVEIEWFDTVEGLCVEKFRAVATGVAALQESLAWIKRVDGELTTPRYADLTLDQLKTRTELQLGGHRKSDKKHLFIKAEEFRHLAPLTGLKKLHLGENDGVTDEALAHVGKLTGLTELILWDAPMTDAGVKHLIPLKNLTYLDLAFATKITNAALPDIVQLPKLEKLNVAGTKVNDVAPLAGLKQLKELRLGKLKPKGVDDLKKANPTLLVK